MSIKKAAAQSGFNRLSLQKPRSSNPKVAAANTDITRLMCGNGSDIKPDIATLRHLRARTGPRPKTAWGPLHIQSNQHGDREYLSQLIKEVFSWPDVESVSSGPYSNTTIPIRWNAGAATLDRRRFIGEREFARVLPGALTIYVALPLVYARWAIVEEWAELHYLVGFGLMPVGTVLLYTPRNPQELSVCCALFAAAYHSALPHQSGERSA